MKRFIKGVIRLIWKMTAPFRRPIARKVESRMNHMITDAIRTQLLPTIHSSLASSTRSLDRLEASLGAANHPAHLLACDMDLLLGSIVREVARLQLQVEAIQDLIEHAVAPGHKGLSLVEPEDEGEPVGWPSGVERSKVG